MRYRNAIIEKGKVLDDSGTLTKDMDIVDPVSAIEFEFHATNYSDGNEDNFISDVITKIEIVDGSDVLYSVNLSELEALHFYKTGKTPVLFPSEWLSGQQRHACLLLFGRHLWDKEYAMDFTRFRNPQLKITSNLAAIRSVGSLGFTTSTLTCTIVAKVMEDMPARPTKYLMAKEFITWTSGTSGDKRIDLPRDYVTRMVMARLWVEGSDIDEVITDLKITCDTDKFVLLDQDLSRLDEDAFMRFGRCALKHDVHRSGSCTIRSLCNKEPDMTVYCQDPGQPQTFVKWAQWSSTINLECYTGAGALDGTARDQTGMETGHALHATLPIPFGELNDPETWFDPTVYGKVEWVGTEGVAAACALVAEQVRPLP